MSLSPLLPIAGTALQPVAERAMDGLASGLSFLDFLHSPDAEPAESIDESGGSDAQVNLKRFVKQLRERFAALGIRTATPVHLKLDGREGVIVDGDHSDRVLIESLFDTDDELTSRFRALAAFAAREQKLDEDYTAEDFRLEVDPSGASIAFA